MQFLQGLNEAFDGYQSLDILKQEAVKIYVVSLTAEKEMNQLEV